MPDEILENFWNRIEIQANGCWFWITGKTTDGYGQFFDGNKMVRAHRFAYEQINNEKIPKGMQLDHLCRNRHCVNPKHLEAVTNKINTLRGEGACAKNARKTHCKRGHLLANDNLYIDPKGSRRCRICVRDANKKRKLL